MSSKFYQVFVSFWSWRWFDRYKIT